MSTADEARAEAERRWPTRTARIPGVFGTTYQVENPRVDGFTLGAEWQASRKVEGTDTDPEWLERVNRALWQYDQKTLDVRGVADVLASQSVQVEVTDEMVDRVAAAIAALSTALGGGK